MAINNSYPEIEVLDSGDLLLVADISQNNSTKLVKIQTLANYIGSGGGGGEGSGTVTSVDATAGAGISVSGVPITTSGTITITNTAPDTGVPAILSNGSVPTLNTGITAEEIRTLIGVGTSEGTNLSGQLTSTTVRINSNTGNDVTIDGATSSYAGVMTAADKTKLDGIGSTDSYVQNSADTYTSTSKITQIVTLTQAEYDNISSPVNGILYIIL